jgi:hypothetical protein
MRRTLVLWSLAFGLIVAGCGAASDEQPMTETGRVASAAGADVEKVVAQEAEGTTGMPGSSLTDQLIIRNADMRLVVKDAEAALEQITALVNEAEGFVVSSRLTKLEQGTRVSLVVRVPAESLDNTLERIRGLALEVRSQEVTGEDVTEEYTDLQAQLRHLEATETRLLTFMDQAEDTEATLAVYHELQDIQGQIERTKGRIQYLEQSSALSTIQIELVPEAVDQPISVAGWRPQGTLRDAVQALVNTLQFLVDAAIWVVAFLLPIAVVVFAIPAGIVFYLLRRRRTVRRQVKE